MQFKSIALVLLFSLPAFAKSVTPRFNCKDLSGTYECGVKKGLSAAIIEMNGQEITFIDDANMPLTLKIDGIKNEASSEKQHVVYKATCKKDRIEIESTVTNLTGDAGVQKVKTKFDFVKSGELGADSYIQSARSAAYVGTTCSRIEAE